MERNFGDVESDHCSYLTGQDYICQMPTDAKLLIKAVFLASRSDVTRQHRLCDVFLAEQSVAVVACLARWK
eukprot:scaffold61881_cov36-Prasinocladus_malaysianus.AAC.1